MPDITSVSESLDILIQGLRAMVGGLENHTKILTHQTGQLDDILDILTREPEGDSPLVETLKALVEAVGKQTDMLVRIEAAMARRAPV